MDVKKILDYWSLLEYVEQFVNVAAAGRWGEEIEADILPEGLKELQKLIVSKCLRTLRCFQGVNIQESRRPDV